MGRRNLCKVFTILPVGSMEQLMGFGECLVNCEFCFPLHSGGKYRHQVNDTSSRPFSPHFGSINVAVSFSPSESSR